MPAYPPKPKAPPGQTFPAKNNFGTIHIYYCINKCAGKDFLTTPYLFVIKKLLPLRRYLWATMPICSMQQFHL